jgi:hypothetical protein
MFRRRKETTKITIETHEFIRVSLNTGTAQASYCPDCGREVGVLDRRGAALLLGIAQPEVDSEAEFGGVHRTTDGAYCGESLAEIFQRRDDPESDR